MDKEELPIDEFVERLRDHVVNHNRVLGETVLSIYERLVWLESKIDEVTKQLDHNVQAHEKVKPKKETGRTLADLSVPYQGTAGRWCVDEQLYPESRGYNTHEFETRQEAEAFLQEYEE